MIMNQIQVAFDPRRFPEQLPVLFTGDVAIYRRKRKRHAHGAAQLRHGSIGWVETNQGLVQYWCDAETGCWRPLVRRNIDLEVSGRRFESDSGHEVIIPLTWEANTPLPEPLYEARANARD